MSIKLMGLVWDMNIPLGEKMVLLKLADRANDDGECWPGQQSLAKQVSMSDRALRDNLAKIKARGLVEIETRRKGGRQGTNLYRLTLQPEVSSACKSEKQAAQAEVSSACNAAPGGSLRQSQVEVCDIVYKEESSVEPPVVITNVITPPRVALKSEPKDKTQITFDAEQGIFVNIHDQQMDSWEEAFPKLDIDAELTRAEVWYKANPRRRKKNNQRFLVNWLAKAHTRMTTPQPRFQKQQPSRIPTGR